MESKELIVTANNISVCYNESGISSVPVIFIHGFPFDKNMWNPQMKAFENIARVISYDICGYGKSTADHEKPAISLFADDLIKFMDVLQVDKATICGVSMGGYIALDVLYRYPNRFAGIILSDTQCIADTAETKTKRYETIKKIEENGLNDFAEGFVKNIFSEFTLNHNNEVVNQIKQTILSTPVETVISTLKALAERWEKCSTLNEINIPALILCGAEDKVTPVVQSEFLNKNISNSVLHVIEKAGHLPNLEQPEIFNGFLHKFISNLVAIDTMK
ncbi:MAG: alpha/beta hydrolase [Bacteroidota bacterium]